MAGKLNHNLFPYVSLHQDQTVLTVLVARLSEGLSFGENDGYSQILEGGDVEEGGVLVVFDVFVVMGACYIWAVRKTGSGNITGTKGGEQQMVNANIQT